MSKKYEMVKDFYDRGLWNLTRVKNAVIKEWITEEEFKMITGYEYDNLK